MDKNRQFQGQLIKLKLKCIVYHVYVNNINIECYFVVYCNILDKA